MPWKFNGNEPLFMQIAKHLRSEIISGKYMPDEQIPPVRQLAYEAAVNPNTMQKALCLLESEGLVYSRGTVGRFITPDVSIIENARSALKLDTVRGWLREADELGIDTEELIGYINQIKEENTL